MATQPQRWMDLVTVRQLDDPGTQRPNLVCGLPDSGYVAKVAMDILLEQLKPRLWAEIYSPAFPPQVVIDKEGVARLPRNEFYAWRAPQGERDLLLYTGDVQPTTPAGAFALARYVMDVAQRFEVPEILILAAFIRGHPVEQPRVFVTAYPQVHAGDFEGVASREDTEANITWMHGLLLGEARLREIPVACLSGETSGQGVDENAGRAVLRVAARRLQLPVELPGETGDVAEDSVEAERAEERRRTGYIQ